MLLINNNRINGYRNNGYFTIGQRLGVLIDNGLKTNASTIFSRNTFHISECFIGTIQNKKKYKYLMQ